MCIAYGLNWLYFDVDNTNLQMHAIRRSVLSSVLHGVMHLPFIMVRCRTSYLIQGMTLVGAALEYLVIATDSDSASSEWLTEEYQVHSEDHTTDGLRWFFCGGLAMGLFCMGIPLFSDIEQV